MNEAIVGLVLSEESLLVSLFSPFFPNLSVTYPQKNVSTDFIIRIFLLPLYLLENRTRLIDDSTLQKPTKHTNDDIRTATPRRVNLSILPVF